MTELLFKILDETGQSCDGGNAAWSLPTKNDDGSWTPGEWMPEIVGQLEPCENGHHLARECDLLHWLGPTIYLAETHGERMDHDDKVVVRQARLLRKVETWNERTARLFAVWCAREALKLLDENEIDPRLVQAINVAERYALGQATGEELSAARDAARDVAWAACAAASAAARDASAAARDASAAAWAARDAAWAARGAQTKKLLKMLEIVKPSK